jgi:septation ring formation regulator EzrA
MSEFTQDEIERIFEVFDRRASVKDLVKEIESIHEELNVLHKSIKRQAMIIDAIQRMLDDISNEISEIKGR